MKKQKVIGMAYINIRGVARDTEAMQAYIRSGGAKSDPAKYTIINR